jgi:tetratricopeptide (TPR) repeat protein
MADIFVSYTSSDKEWAHWIAQELEALGHTARVHEWEISAGGDIPEWMEESLEEADHCLLVVSKTYLTKPYSSWERRAAQWAAASKRPNFALPVFIEVCDPPLLLAHLKRCALHGLSEEEARASLTEFLRPAQKPSAPLRFPGNVGASTGRASVAPVAFPGNVVAISNVPIRVPTHFMGRDDALVAIEREFGLHEGRVAITALHGLRGVGKTTLAAAYADQRRVDYRATWWIRAQTEAGIRADLVALGIRLGWVGSDDKEEPAVEAVMERLRHEGEGTLLIFDNAVDAKALNPYLPRGGGARVLVTSNAHAWRGVAAPIEIAVWSKDIGADYLIARTGRADERAAAEMLSEALGGLPLALEQAAAYCEDLSVSHTEYRRRFEAATGEFLDDKDYAPAEYHDHLTVAGTFMLGIDQAAKRHPAAEPLIVHAALLAPEPIPLFLFAEARKKFGKQLAAALAGKGLDEAVAALRAFALVSRETIMDERDASVTTDAIRLHRLVREVAAARRKGKAQASLRCALVAALAAVYPPDGYRNPAVWPRCAPLTPHVVSACRTGIADDPAQVECADLLNRAGVYFHGRAAYSAARPLLERALAIREKVLGAEHPDTATNLNNLARLVRDHGDPAAARRLCERALAIREKVLGPEHPDTAANLNELAGLLSVQRDLPAARRLCERALAIREKVRGPEHPDTATSLNSLAGLLRDQGDLAAPRPLFERALAIREKVLGPEHPDTATSLNNLASLLCDQGDLAAARPLYERALAICEKVFGPEHPDTAADLHNLARLLCDQGDLAAARPLCERALAICEKVLGPEHPATASNLNNLAGLFRDQGDLAAARPLYERALAIYEKVVGPEHPAPATTLHYLAGLLRDQGDLAAARPLYERALAICEKVLGPKHPATAATLLELARLLHDQGDLAAARPLYERALAIYEKVLGPEHPDTNRVRSALLRARGRQG